MIGGIVSLALILLFSGCVEHRYYQEHNRHSDDYYHRRHMDPPHGAGVDIDIHR